ncbi:MAG TPA: 5'/3'-nucleotidase SurE [Chloroflexia bacterium]|nr:5'/3'-nucleotidase SurE [Chloroflexia bacterium]
MRILLTNDDGVTSEGLLALHTALAPDHEVVIIAPDRNWSISGHNRTMDRPIRVNEVTLRDGTQAYSSDGSPADCVALAALGFLPEKPELVISGINNGYNLADDITYSGTVAAAMEGIISEIPAIAVSADTHPVWQIEVAAGAVARLVEQVAKQGLDNDILLNVNVPSLTHEEIKGVQITRLGKRVYQDKLIERLDPRGRKYYWIGGTEVLSTHMEGTDATACEHGYVSVTPIHLDFTNHALLDRLRSWDLRF